MDGVARSYGVDVIDRAIELVHDEGGHLAHFENAFASWSPMEPVVNAMKTCWRAIDRIAHRFKDSATHRYGFVDLDDPYPVEPDVDPMLWEDHTLDGHDDDMPYQPPPRPKSPRAIERFYAAMAREKRRAARGVEDFDRWAWSKSQEPRVRRKSS